MPPPKLLYQVGTVVRVEHFSLSSERAYVGWIRRFILSNSCTQCFAARDRLPKRPIKMTFGAETPSAS